MKKRSCLIASGIVALCAACLAADDARPLREMIIENAGALRGKNVWVDIFGQPMRASFAGADATGMTVELMGQTVVLPWERVSPRRLIRTALKVASSAAEFASAARFAHAEGLDEEAHRILDKAAEKYPDAADETAALQQELFPEAPRSSVEEKSAPSPAPKTAAEPVPATTSKVQPSAVPTFHCLGVYWSPEKGEAGKKVLVRYRESGQREWRDGLPMRHNPVNTPQCRADYRGSIVNLRPGTVYEIALSLEGTDIRTAFRAATWSEKFPVAEVVKGASGSSTFNVSRSGTPEGYVLYDGSGATIDTGNKSDVGIAVNASYVIIRGFTIRNVKQHGIQLFSGHHIVIEGCDISKWGSEDEKGFGKDCQGGVYSKSTEVRAVVIQRCKIHHPSWDSNSWAEQHGRSKHPAGPQTVVFWRTKGNHVIRYNELWSDKDHYFNDVMGIWDNASYVGFLVADSDVYCNYIANCWDDGIESEGANQNVRIWNNYIEEVMIPIGNAPVTIGPLYAWRNVSGRCYSPPGSQWNMTHGPFFKMGFAGAEKWMTGHMYIFNNTIFQPGGEGSGGLGGSSRVIKHCVTRNNILHVRASDSRSISTGKSEDNDLDYDLLSARYPADQEEHGVSGVPRYVTGAGFSFETKTGNFQLAPGSKGYDMGVIIPNFCDVFTGNGPDMGAHEAGTAKMQYGVKAKFVPPGAPTSAAGPATAAPGGGPSWTVKFDFNDGEVGQMVPGLGAAGRTRFTTEQSYEGGKAVSLEAKRGKENFGRWGGTVEFPAKLRKGDEVWWRVRTYWPKGMDYSASPRLKFLRVHTCTPEGRNRGYNDIYINSPGSKTPFQFIYEGAHKWKPVSGASDAIVHDTWETYEYYLKLDDRSVDDGGQARVRFWKNGKLLADVTDRKTLKDPKDYANAAFLFTYWNSSPYMGQIVYEEGGGPLQPKEMVECSQHPDVKFQVVKTAPGAVYLQDPNRDWRKRVRPFRLLKPGEKITGLTSKHTCTVKEILHSHPLMDIKVYVDDMVITCKRPEGRDAQGNPCIGAEKK